MFELTIRNAHVLANRHFDGLSRNPEHFSQCGKPYSRVGTDMIFDLPQKETLVIGHGSSLRYICFLKLLRQHDAESGAGAEVSFIAIAHAPWGVYTDA